MYSPDDLWPGSANFYLRAGADYQPQRLPDSSKRSFFYLSGPLLRFKGSVNYTLRATLSDGKESVARELAVVNQASDPNLINLNHWIGRQHETTFYALKTQQTSFWKRKFSDDHGPMFKLFVEFQSKQVLFLDARDDENLPFRMRVNVQHQAEDGIRLNHATPPPVYLTRLSLSLKGKIAARTNPIQNAQYLPYSAHGLDEREIFGWKEVSKNKARTPIALDTFWDIGSRVGATYDALKSKANDRSQASRRSQPMDLVPDLCLPNLVRSYSLVWSMRFECGGSRVDWMCDGGMPVMLAAAGGLVESDEALPAYEPMSGFGEPS